MRIVAINTDDKTHLLLERWSAGGHDAHVISLAAVAELEKPLDAEVILLDLRGASVEKDSALARHLDGKVVIDCSNVRDVAELRSGSASIAEQVAQACPGASVVKAFNVITAAALRHVLEQAGSEGRKGFVSGYYCGDTGVARQTIAALIAEALLDPADCGPLSNATLLEALGLLTRQLAEIATSGPHFAVSIVRAHANASPLDHWM